MDLYHERLARDDGLRRLQSVVQGTGKRTDEEETMTWSNPRNALITDTGLDGSISVSGRSEPGFMEESDAQRATMTSYPSGRVRFPTFLRANPEISSSRSEINGTKRVVA